MPKIIKYSLLAVGALLALLIVAAVVISATFDPNDYKPTLERMVQEKTQRTLNVPGEIKLGFFPNIALELGAASLSDRNSERRFASVESARLSLALLPLIAKKVVVDKIGITGLRVDIVRNKDGSTNYGDLMSGEGGGGQQVLFDIDSIRIKDAQVVVDDRQQGRRFEVARFNLETGRIADRVPARLQLSADLKGNQPQVDAHLALQTGYTLDLGDKRFTLKGLDAELKGALLEYKDVVIKAAGDADLWPESHRIALDGIKLGIDGKRAEDVLSANLTIPKLAVTDKQVSGGKLSGDARLVSGTRTIKAGFSLPGFEGSAQAFTLPAFALDATVKDGALDVNGRLSGALSGNIDKLLFTSQQLTLSMQGKQGDNPIGGTLTTPLSAALQEKKISLSGIAADFKLPNPAGGTMALVAHGNASADLAAGNAGATLNGKLDQSAFDARLGLAAFSPLSYTFDIGIDQLDLDRYRPKDAQAAAPKAAPAPAPAPAPAAGKPADLSALQALRAKGSLRIGKLTAANIHSANVRVDLRAADGKIEASPVAANLYGGSVSGVLTLTAAQPARIAVRQTLSGIHLGPLLKDAIGKDPIEGKGSVQLDVTTAGTAFDMIMKNLNGSAQLELRDGAVRGVNIAQVVRGAKSKLDALRGNAAPQSGTSSASEKTDFSEMSASFRIANGVAHNEDLLIKSPLLRVTGSGDVNLAAERLDYVARATVVSSLQGQGGPELQALRGVTVPVKLSGPFAALDWHVDVAGMAGEMAKQKLEGKKEELKERAQKSLGGSKEKLQDQLKGQLKGLFGK